MIQAYALAAPGARWGLFKRGVGGEVVVMLLADICHFKIINYQGETDWVGVMLPKIWRLVTLAVSVFGKPFFEKFLRYDPYVGEPVHALFNAQYDKTFRIGLLS